MCIRDRFYDVGLYVFYLFVCFFFFFLFTVYICLRVCECFFVCVCNFVLFVFAMGRVAWNKPVMMTTTFRYRRCDKRHRLNNLRFADEIAAIRDNNEKLKTVLSCDQHSNGEWAHGYEHKRWQNGNPAHWKAAKVWNRLKILFICSTNTSRTRFRSGSSLRYEQPRTQLKFGQRAFSYAALAAWNSLPLSCFTVLITVLIAVLMSVLSLTSFYTLYIILDVILALRFVVHHWSFL